MGKTGASRSTRPPSTPAIIGWLLGSESDLRVLACEELARRGVPTTGALLVLALDDEVAPVREAAARACGRIKGPGARRSLTRALLDPVPRVALAARESLDELDRDEIEREPARPCEPELVLDHIQGARDDDPVVRQQALSILGACAHSGSLIAPVLLGALEDAVPSVRAQAVAGLRRHPAAHSTELLLDAIEDDDANVRTECARTLGHLRIGAAFSSLVAALGDDFQSVRSAAAHALARIGGDRATGELHQAACTWTPGSPSLLEALDQLEEDVLNELTLWLSHPYEGVRGVALDAVVLRKELRLEREVAQLTRDPVEWLRHEARDALEILNAGRCHRR